MHLLWDPMQLTLSYQGKKNRLVGYKDGHVYDIDIEEAFKMKKSIDDYEYQVASILGTRCDYKNI